MSLEYKCSECGGVATVFKIVGGRPKLACETHAKAGESWTRLDVPLKKTLAAEGAKKI